MVAVAVVAVAVAVAVVAVVAAISRTMWMHSLTPASTCLIPFQQKSLIVPSFEGCD